MPTVPHPAAKIAPPARVARWIALGLFWMLALGGIAVYSLNFRTTLAEGTRLEQALRRAQGSAAAGDPLAGLARQALPLMLDPDSYLWINLAQTQAREGRWRTRETAFDNAPAGRASHWSSGFAWWLRLLGQAGHVATGKPPGPAIADAAAWANPLLGALFLGGLLLALRRRMRPWMAGTLAVTLASLVGVDWDFGYARPDHHGLHQIAFLGMLLSLLAAGLGWVREGAPDAGGHTGFLAEAPPRWQARRWFALSGFFAGVGMWIGATQQMFLIGSAGVGAALGIGFFARAGTGGRARFAPELWRGWGQMAAVTSFGFYLLEYFPYRLTMRLEVNHPLYSLALLGGGELLCALARSRLGGDETMRCRIMRGTVLGLGCLALLPVAVLLGPREWYGLRDPFLHRVMHTVSEGRPFVDPWSAWGSLRELCHHFGALPFAVPLAAAAVWRRPGAMPWQRAALAVGLCVAVTCLGWLQLQGRWEGLAGAALAVLALVCVPAGWGWKGNALPLGLLALAGPGWVGFWLAEMEIRDDPPLGHVRTLLGENLATQELAWAIRREADAAGIAEPRVMAPMGIATALQYFGGARSVGSLYWENLVGCRALADFYSDEGDAVAHRIAQKRGLDFVVAITRPDFVREIRFLAHGDNDPAAMRRSLAYRLANPVHAQPPDWLEPVPLVGAPVAERGYRLYRVGKRSKAQGPRPLNLAP